MEFVKKIPATIALIVINCAVFAWVYLEVGSFEEPAWSRGLLNSGALYNAFTLNGEWWRLFTHMFLHGFVLHLASNMVGLFLLGTYAERLVGSGIFLLVYFISGLIAGLCSLYFNLFTVAVGASGAVFGLLGFVAVIYALENRHDERKLVAGAIIVISVLVISFGLEGIAPTDIAAHVGGLLCGIFLGFLSIFQKQILILYLSIVPIFIILFLALPRYQVNYYNFFQKVLEAQDSSSYVLNNSDKKSNEQFVTDYRRVNLKWDTALNMLNAEKYLPSELSSDTFKLRRFIHYHKAEADYRSTMVERESYIYADSIDIASDSIRKYTRLQYILNFNYTPPDTTQQPEGPPLETIKIWYDSNWVEIPYPPSKYFRIGQRDTAGLWQGPLADYFNNGIIQMKGSYKDDAKDGIFIYYTVKGAYSAAGVYNNDQRVGKWETFHPNGKIESEVYYRDRYFLKSYWDSTGVQMVTNGKGKEIHRYPNDVVAIEGNYVDGYQEGYWYGRHKDGSMYFEENYARGRLVNGRSRSRNGRTAVYDETIFFALPDGGYKKLNEYIRSQAEPQGKGTVKLSFRVTVSGQLTDFKTEKSVSKELDLRAKQIILAGPRWLPARLHGLEPTDGFAVVSVEF
ncbi:MAG: rhomboid family intramembrane serine protease [Bacteroidota bacterium]